MKIKHFQMESSISFYIILKTIGNTARKGIQITFPNIKGTRKVWRLLLCQADLFLARNERSLGSPGVDTWAMCHSSYGRHFLITHYRRTPVFQQPARPRVVQSARGSKDEVAQSCPTLCDPKDCSPPGSSIHGVFLVQHKKGVGQQQ